MKYCSVDHPVFNVITQQRAYYIVGYISYNIKYSKRKKTRFILHLSGYQIKNNTMLL